MSAMINSIQPRYASHILLYHATYQEPPNDIAAGLHNVTPDVIEAQLRWIRRQYDIVPVDQLLADESRGQVAITFDDAYESVFTEAAPRLLAMQVPFTIYVSGAGFQGRCFWRDKARFIMNGDLTAAFIDYLCTRPGEWGDLTPKNFYAASKQPHIDIPAMDGHMDAFLEGEGSAVETPCRWMTDPAKLIRDPLITYGNHGTNHYILAALSDEQQAEEIGHTHALLAGLDIPLSRLFSIPFGGPQHVNATTFAILRRLGYQGMLYAQGRCNRFDADWKARSRAGLVPGNRLMAPTTLAALKERLAHSFVDTR